MLRKHWGMVILVLVGFGLRLLVAMRGHNYDFDSWVIVARIKDHGGNVYAETARYNYGPVWANVLLLLYRIAGGRVGVFRYVLVGFLSLADVGILAVLYRKYGFRVGAFFFLNPVSIVITGYHNQFDNLAILTAMVGVLLIGDEFEKGLDGRKWGGTFVLGFSMMIKHVVFLFPLWLAIKQRGIKEKLVYGAVPPAVFLLGFLPSWREGREGILNNVFFYQSIKSDLFYRVFLPGFLREIVPTQALWVLILLGCGVLLRKRGGLESLLFFSCAMVATSPAIANQYLAIPMAWIVTQLNLFSLMYLTIATWHLLVDGNGLHFEALEGIFGLEPWAYYLILVVLLAFSFGWAVWGKLLRERVL